ncbi:Protein NDR1 [Bienertia sinuspersici]
MVTEDTSCCRCCCSFIFTLGLTALFLWLNLKTNNPTCSIENFDVFVLNKTAPNFIIKNNHTIRYDLKLNNKNNKDKGIYYDTLNLTFYHKPNTSLITLGNATFDPFYQGHEKSTHRINTLDARGVKWENATAVTAKFRVELNTSVRFKIVFWKTKRRRLELGADLEVNDQGSLVKKKKKGVKLTSGATNNKGCYFELLPYLSVFILFCFW